MIFNDECGTLMEFLSAGWSIPLMIIKIFENFMSLELNRKWNNTHQINKFIIWNSPHI